MLGECASISGGGRLESDGNPMLRFLNAAHRKVLDRPESFRVGLTIALNLAIVFGLWFPLFLLGNYWLLAEVVLLIPIVLVANRVARVLTGVDLQRRWFR